MTFASTPWRLASPFRRWSIPIDLKRGSYKLLLARHSAMNRFGNTEETANAIVWVLNEASFVNGAVWQSTVAALRDLLVHQALECPRFLTNRATAMPTEPARKVNDSEYLWLKFAHILIAITIGTSAGLAFWLELQTTRYVATCYAQFGGCCPRRLSVTSDAHHRNLDGHLARCWTRTGPRRDEPLAWRDVHCGSVFVLKKQISVFESDGPSSRAYRRRLRC
jgi:hypothetical protein